MIKRFNKVLKNHNLPQKGERGLVAVSGGVDSMVLLHLLLASNVKVEVAHMNYQLRGEDSDQDEKLAKQFCSERNIPFYSKRANVKAYQQEHSVGLQEAARNLRYQWFEELLNANSLAWVATAHHRDDQSETVLMHLLRGAGTKGMSGIQEFSNKRFRPLLSFSKNEIREYASQEKVDFREDATNKTRNYERNKIRLDVLPLLEEIKPGSSANLSRSARLFDEADSILNGYCEAFLKEHLIDFNGSVSFPLVALRMGKAPMSLLHHWLLDKGASSAQLEEIMEIANSQSGKKVILEKGTVFKDREALIYTEKSGGDVAAEVFRNVHELLESPSIEQASIAPYGLRDLYVNECLLDASKLNWPLTIRQWKEGDNISPIGMHGKQKISRILIQEKLPQHLKGEVKLLTDSKGEVLWMIGFKTSRIAMLDDQTGDVMHVVVTNALIPQTQDNGK